MKEKDKEYISEWISRLRAMNNLTQAEFAEKVGLSSRQIAKYEAGEATPRARNLFRIKEAFDPDKDSHTKLELSLSDGETGTMNISVGIAEKTSARLKKIAESEGRSLGNVIEDILEKESVKKLGKSIEKLQTSDDPDVFDQIAILRSAIDDLYEKINEKD